MKTIVVFYSHWIMFIFIPIQSYTIIYSHTDPSEWLYLVLHWIVLVWHSVVLVSIIWIFMHSIILYWVALHWIILVFHGLYYIVCCCMQCVIWCNNFQSLLSLIWCDIIYNIIWLWSDVIRCDEMWSYSISFDSDVMWCAMDCDLMRLVNIIQYDHIRFCNSLLRISKTICSIYFTTLGNYMR